MAILDDQAADWYDQAVTQSSKTNKQTVDSKTSKYGYDPNQSAGGVLGYEGPQYGGAQAVADSFATDTPLPEEPQEQPMSSKMNKQTVDSKTSKTTEAPQEDMGYVYDTGVLTDPQAPMKAERIVESVAPTTKTSKADKQVTQKMTPAVIADDYQVAAVDSNVGFGGGDVTDTPATTTQFETTVIPDQYVVLPTEGSSLGPNGWYQNAANPLQTRYNQLKGQVSGVYSDVDALNDFTTSSLRDGWSPEEIDAAMLFPAGTTTSYVNQAGINVENKLNTDTGLYQAASNDYQKAYNASVRAVADGVLSEEAAVNQLMQASLQTLSPSQLDAAMQWEAGTSQNWIDITGTAGVITDPTVDTPTDSTPVTSPNADGLTGPVGTIGPGSGNTIPMSDGVNVGMANMGLVREATTATMAAENNALASYYDMNAMYSPKESMLLSEALVDVLDKDNDYMKQMREEAMAGMANRGMGGSASEAAAVAGASIAAALEIAQGDVRADAFNAEQYNQMMDRRQAQYGDIVGTAQRGSIDFLKNMQTSVNGLIEADVKQSFDIAMENLKSMNLADREIALATLKSELDMDMEDLKTGNYLDREKMDYSASMWAAHNEYKQIVSNDRDLDLPTKNQLIWNNLVSTVSAMNSLEDIAAGINLKPEDFMEKPDEDFNYGGAGDTSVAPATYTEATRKTALDKTVSHLDDVSRQIEAANPGISKEDAFEWLKYAEDKTWEDTAAIMKYYFNSKWDIPDLYDTYKDDPIRTEELNKAMDEFHSTDMKDARSEYLAYYKLKKELFYINSSDWLRGNPHPYNN